MTTRDVSCARVKVRTTELNRIYAHGETNSVSEEFNRLNKAAPAPLHPSI